MTEWRTYGRTSEIVRLAWMIGCIGVHYGSAGPGPGGNSQVRTLDNITDSDFHWSCSVTEGAAGSAERCACVIQTYTPSLCTATTSSKIEEEKQQGIPSTAWDDQGLHWNTLHPHPKRFCSLCLAATSCPTDHNFLAILPILAILSLSIFRRRRTIGLPSTHKP